MNESLSDEMIASLERENRRRELAAKPLRQFDRGILTVGDLAQRLAEIVEETK